jgi:hypothetical protein
MESKFALMSTGVNLRPDRSLLKITPLIIVVAVVVVAAVVA